MLGLFRFCLDFSEFGYVTDFFYVPDFFYVSKKLRKSLGHRKVSVLVFFTNKSFKKTRHISMFFGKKHRKSLGHRKKLGLCHFLTSFF
jgi:hypothetical protein